LELHSSVVAQVSHVRVNGGGRKHSELWRRFDPHDYLLPEIRALHICLAPLAEQHEIIRSVEAAIAWTDRIDTETTRARKLIDHLDNAILMKAFQGGLVAQDPGDEPASVLLERIKAERVSNETAAKEKKPRGNIRPKARLVRSQKSSGKRKARRSKS
jgi:hypothetical protein